MKGTVFAQIGYLGRRSLRRTLRQPAAAVPAILFPLLFLSLMNGAAGPAANIPGFPAPTYLHFLLGGLLIQGVVFGGINAGTDLAVDIEDGFLERLSLTPVRRIALLLGQAAGSLAIGAVVISVLMGAAMLGGVEIRTGFPGMLVMLGLSLITSLAFSGFGFTLALRTGSSEAVQSSFPLFFIIITFTSFFMPREFIDVAWFRTVATYNPATYLMEAMRELIINGWDVFAIGRAYAISAGMAVIALAIASRLLKVRLAR